MIDLFLEISSQIEKYYISNLNDYNLSYMQWKMLKVIYEDDSQSLRAKDIEIKLNQNKRLTSINLTKLEELDYIERLDVEGDKREKRIILTGLSLDFCDDLILLEENVKAIIEGGLSGEEEVQLEGILEKIKNNFDNIYNNS